MAVAKEWERDQETLREKDKKLHKALCRQLKEILRSDPMLVVGNLNN